MSRTDALPPPALIPEPAAVHARLCEIAAERRFLRRLLRLSLAAARVRADRPAGHALPQGGATCPR